MVEGEGWGGFGFGGWAGRQGRRFRWRVFERGDLKFVILRLLSRQPMHGYEIMQALEKRAGGWYRASPGSVYPTLQMLEDQGLVSSQEEGGKRVYSITEEGRGYLERHGDLVDEIFDRVEAFTHRFWNKDTRDLSSAFSRLAQVTFETALTPSLNSEARRRIKEILERAREEILEIRRGRSREEEKSGEGGRTEAGS